MLVPLDIIAMTLGCQILSTSLVRLLITALVARQVPRRVLLELSETKLGEPVFQIAVPARKGTSALERHLCTILVPKGLTVLLGRPISQLVRRATSVRH